MICLGCYKLHNCLQGKFKVTNLVTNHGMSASVAVVCRHCLSATETLHAPVQLAKLSVETIVGTADLRSSSVEQQIYWAIIVLAYHIGLKCSYKASSSHQGPAHSDT